MRLIASSSEVAAAQLAKEGATERLVAIATAPADEARAVVVCLSLLLRAPSCPVARTPVAATRASADSHVCAS